MIKATFIIPETGQERTVQILRVEPDKLVRVSPIDHLTAGYWWDEFPQWAVDQTSLINHHMDCMACGETFPLPGICHCGWDPKNDVAISDEQDQDQTIKDLRLEYKGV